MPQIYELKPERKNLHGHFSRNLAPALTIDSGDTVRFQTLDANWGLESYQVGQWLNRRQVEGRISPEDDGHALTGPVFIRGAKAGMTLEVQIGEIIPATYGWCIAGGRKNPLNERYGIVDEGVLHVYELDTQTMIGRNQNGHKIALRPFMGVMGMPADVDGVQSTIPPRITGGNIDCKELVAGSRLFLPIQVDGGLFSTGDGHGAQGNGESGITAIECPIERVDMTFHVHDDMPLTTPIASTPAGWLTLGFHEDLNEATYIALNAMFDLIMKQYSVNRPEAVALTSVAVDLCITQIVNNVKGVHALLPWGAIR
jgi:acetamidase/formamidase